MDERTPNGCPLSESQLRFWRGHMLAPDAPIYNMAWRFDLHLALEPKVFTQALEDVVAGSDILRAVFRITDGIPRQHISTLPFQMNAPVDLSNEIASKDALDGYLMGWVSNPFDLSVSSLRTHLVKLSDTHWVWVICQHHIACDAQSSAVLFQAVSKRYEALLEGASPEPVQLAPYFAKATEMQAEGPVTDIAKTRPSTPPYGAPAPAAPWSSRLALPGQADQQDAIARFCAAPEFRLFTPDLSQLALFATAYLAYLHRVTGDERLTIGMPSHNRLSVQDRDTLGLFMEVMPLSVDVDATDSLAELHSKVKTALGAFLRNARPGAVAGQNTGDIGAVLNFIKARFGPFAGAPATVEWLHSGAHDGAHALRLHVTDFDDKGTPSLSMDVSATVLSQTTGHEIQQHFDAVLCALINDPHQPLAAVSLTSRVDRTATLSGPPEAADTTKTIVDLIAAQTLRTPDAIALQEGAQCLSYAQLDARSDAAAALIHSQASNDSKVIAVHMPRSPGCLIAILGILKAGCAFVPIAANTPMLRVQKIIADSGAAAVFTTQGHAPDFGIPRLNVPQSSVRSGFHLAPPQNSDLAYILYTSGSTGVPKGVAVDHSGLSRYVQWAAGAFGVVEKPDYPFFSSISFDLTLTSLFAPLVCGGRVVVYPETTGPDLAVLDVFAQDVVDVVKLTPSHLALVSKSARRVDRIKTLVLGGENLTTAACRNALSALSPDLEIINEYGPTEAVVGCMIHHFDQVADSGASVPVGLPAPGVTISLRDGGLNLCPAGVVGEIVIGGRVACGYFGDVERTQTLFSTDPQDAQKRLYRTGDLGRLRMDGTVEYLGRGDHQLKVGGVRVETADIEQAIRTLPAVSAVHIADGSAPANHPHPNQFCTRCGLPDNLPGATFTSTGLCEVCADFDTYQDRAQAYFHTEPELEVRLQELAAKSTGKYDAVMLLSGGKDSTYAAYRLAALTSRVLAVTLDNGYISDGAKTNIRDVVAHLSWDHRFLSTDKMNEIFVDSLNTHANVCQGCFKAIYTLALRTARAEGAATIVTGLSRGQFFETRLTPDLFRTGAPNCAQLDQMVGEARKTYHAEDDEIARLLQTSDLQDGRVLEEVEILDIYRYIDVPVSEIYNFLSKHSSWVRPSDTGRSTNCLINDVGIHVHKARKGFHNYALPYSWDVRMGHKTRTQALDEIDDEIDTNKVRQILDEIGFDEPITPQSGLIAYVAGHGLSDANVWDALQRNLPREMMPKHVVLLDEMPLTPNGKVDTAHLPAANTRVSFTTEFVAPSTEMEHKLATIISAVVHADRIGTLDDFFDLGVDSLAAINIAISANEAGIALPATALFEHRSLGALAQFAQALAPLTEDDDDAPLLDLDDDDLANITQALR